MLILNGNSLKASMVIKKPEMIDDPRTISIV